MNAQADAGEQPCDGQNENQLAAQRNDQRFYAAAQGLENTLSGDVDSGKNQVERDDPNGTDAQLLCLAGQAEYMSERRGEQLQQHGADQHNHKGVQHTVFDAEIDALFIAHTVIERDNRCNRIAQTEGGK